MGRLQNANQYTVKVTRLDDEQTIGTGIVIESGQILTCAHVVRDAAGSDPRYGKRHDVGIVFPKSREGKRIRPARVVACLQRDADGFEDDIVLLELRDGQPPIAPEDYARLGYAENGSGNAFQSLTYVPFLSKPAQRVSGKILGHVPASVGKRLRVDMVQLRAEEEIERGMSGAGVLDEAQNLVIGLLTERHRATNKAWATDHQVLTFEPFNLPLYTEPQPQIPIRPPRPADKPTAAVATRQRMDGAPALIEEWVGRTTLLQALDNDWADGETRITGLIGFGGEGKSSLARRWIDQFLPASLPLGGIEGGKQPDGIFWWAFYDKADVEAFLEAAFTWLAGEQWAQRIRSATARAEAIGWMLREGRYLFVLDGLEVIQHQTGDEYGQFRSAALRQLLDYFAADGHRSHCLITSRAPLLDLLPVTAYQHRDVGRLAAADGRDLLRQFGVTNDDAQLDAVVRQWDGHALTLSLVGTLARRYDGDARRASVGLELQPLERAAERGGGYADQYDHVRRVLVRYDEHLTAAERDFLRRFSVFRTPVEAAQVAQLRGDADAETETTVLKRLVAYRLVRRVAGLVTAHPLVRNYYLAQLQGAQATDAHAAAKQYYLERAGDTPYHPTLADLEPLIEVVHHACRAGAFDEAWEIYWGQVYQKTRRVIIHQLGAYETNLNLAMMFFPERDTDQLPQVGNKGVQRFIINAVGFCLMSLGRLVEAVPFYERHNTICAEMEDWHNASIGYQNVAQVQVFIGRLFDSRQSAERALEFGRRAESKQDEVNSSVRLGWAAHLEGETSIATNSFQQAEELERERVSQLQYLVSGQGVFHADHLRRSSDHAYAQRITEANLTICQRARWADDLSKSYRVLGDLAADEGNHSAARDHYDEALRIARTIQKRDVLIEVLLARGRWRSRWAQLLQDLPNFQNLANLLTTAHADLDEALGYAVSGGYRLYECDIRIGRAWAFHHEGKSTQATQQAQRAAAIAEETGYHWGKVDAAAFLEEAQS